MCRSRIKLRSGRSFQKMIKAPLLRFWAEELPNMLKLMVRKKTANSLLLNIIIIKALSTWLNWWLLRVDLKNFWFLRFSVKLFKRSLKCMLRVMPSLTLVLSIFWSILMVKSRLKWLNLWKILMLPFLKSKSFLISNLLLQRLSNRHFVTHAALTFSLLASFSFTFLQDSTLSSKPIWTMISIKPFSATGQISFTTGTKDSSFQMN